jgi:hypothetical protein
VVAPDHRLRAEDTAAELTRMAVTLAEIDRIRTRPEAVQRIAKGLIETFPTSAFSDRELDFLESIIQFRKVAEFTRRQVEWLLMIRDGLEEVTDVFGFSIRRLLEGCLEARLDLDEDDEEWIALRWSNPQAVRRKFAGRLLRCARALNVIEQEWQPRQYREPELTYNSGTMVFKHETVASGAPTPSKRFSRNSTPPMR